MPIGTGAVLLQTIPVDPFLTDPTQFFSKTAPNIDTIEVMPADWGKRWDTTIPQVGVIQKLRFVVTGKLVVASGGVVQTERWPHGILERLRFTAGGVADLIELDGIDLQTVRFLRYPAYEEAVDTYPGVIGGGPGGTLIGTIAAGTYYFHLTFEVPIVADEGSMIGAIFAQSSAAQLNLHREIATADRLFVDTSKVTLSELNVTTEATVYEIPRDDKTGQMILPDLSRLHGFNATTDFQFNGTGDVKVPLVRSAGQLHRLITTVRSTPTKRLTPHPLAAANSRIDAIALRYGGNKRPMTFDPASMLQARNNNFYGSIPPYDAMVLDLIRENPLRDVLLLAGVTELNIVPRVNSAVTVSGGLVHTVQETLYSGG